MGSEARSTISELVKLFRDAVPVELKVGSKFVTVDAGDVGALSVHTWRISDGYAVTDVDGKRVRMHRLIMGLCDPREVDHVDRNKLNNQRSNLRFCSRSENARNRAATGGRSRFKGVYRHKRAWAAQIKVAGQMEWLGSYPTERQAAAAYDLAACQRHGEFACTNKSLGLL